MDTSIIKMLAKVQGKTIEQVEEDVKKGREAEIRGEKVIVTAPKQKQEKITLPFAGDGICVIPNSALRSALFGAIKRGKRKTMFREKLVASAGITVIFSGFRLDQADLDVWQRALHLSREMLGSQVKFTAGSFLKAIGRNTSGASHEWLKDSFTRLQGAIVEITDGKKTFSGQLIHNYYIDEITKECIIELNPKLANLFSSDGWTGIDWEQRKVLMGKPLALWLHSFYSTHAQPFDYKIETIWRLCGSEAKELYHFKEKLSEAILDLGSVTGWYMEIKNDKLTVSKTLQDVMKRGNHVIEARKPRNRSEETT